MRRRVFLNTALASGAAAVAASKGLLVPREVIAALPASAFGSRSLAEAQSLLLGSVETLPSDLIEIDLSRISENGANVPIRINADRIDKVESISLFSEKNPIPLLANFEMTDMVANRLDTRIRLAGTTQVVVIVKAEGKLYSARKKIKVTVGGCGG